MSVVKGSCYVRRLPSIVRSVAQAKMGHVARLAILLAATSTMCASLAAQTAHFLYSEGLVPATGFTSMHGLALDTNGNVYIADPNAGKIVKETLANGTYTQSVVASGLTDPESLAVDANGNVYYANGAQILTATGGAVFKATLSGGTYTSSPVINQIGQLAGIALDTAGNIYIADAGDGKILKETLAGSTYTNTVIVAANPSTDTNSQGMLNPLVPVAITVDLSGNVYFIDKTGEFEKATPVSGVYTTTVLTSIGTPTNAGSQTFSASLAVAPNGDLYISNQVFAQITKAALNADGSYTVTAFAGISMGNPVGIAVSPKYAVYLADANYKKVYVFQTVIDFGNTPVATTSGTKSLTFSFDTAGMLASAAPFGVLTQGASALDFNPATTQPNTACVAGQAYSAGNTCTVDVTLTPVFTGPRHGAVSLYNSSGAAIATAFISGTGTGPQLIFAPLAQTVLGGGFTVPEGVAVDSSGNVYITDGAVEEVPSGCASSSCVTTLGGGFVTPGGLAVDGAGNVYVADQGNGTVKSMPPGCASPACVTTIGGGFTSPGGIAIDGPGNVYVADNAGQIKSFPAGCSTASCVKTLGGSFTSPAGIAVDGKGVIYVADRGADAVYELPVTCTSSSCVTTLGGGFGRTDGVAVDGAGNIYVTDDQNKNVYTMTPGCTSSACVTTLAFGFAGPFGIAVDASDNLYVVDTAAAAVAKLDRADAPSLSFASTAVGATSSDSPKTVTATNIGTDTLYFPTPSSGNNPGISLGFTLDSSGGSACPLTPVNSAFAGSLAAAASCTLPISFAPTAAGAITGSLVLADTDLNANPSVSQTIGLSGTANLSASSFTVTGLTNAVAGTAQTITVTAQDSHQNTLTSYVGTVHFTSTDPYPAVLPGNYTFTSGDNGVHVFSSGVTLKTVGPQTLMVADTLATGSESATIAAGVAATIAVTLPAATSGTAFTATFQAMDIYRNIATGYNGTARLTTSDAAAGSLGNITFAAGAAQASLTLKTSGMQTVTATDATTASTTGMATTIVLPGPVSALAVTAPSTVTPDISFNFSVTAMDAAGNIATSYTGPVKFSTTDMGNGVTLPNNTSLTGGTGTFHATLASIGHQTITAQDANTPALTATTGQITVRIPYLIVTTTADDAGTATNCTVYSAPGTGTGRNCSLRDALLQAGTIGAGNISFDAKVFAAAQTITLSNGVLIVPGNTSIQGATSTGSTGAVSNLVTVSGNSQYPVFTSSADGVALNNLIVTAGLASIDSDDIGLFYFGGGAGVTSRGSMTISASTIFGNTCTFPTVDAIAECFGGGVYNSGTLTIRGSTVSGNICNGFPIVFAEAPDCFGGGVYNDGNLTIDGSTIAGNTILAFVASGSGGGVYNDTDGTMTITGSTIAGNTVETLMGLNSGGGIYNGGILTVIGSTISGNLASNSSDFDAGSFGGGIYNNKGLALIGVTISGNTVSATGGSQSNVVASGGGVYDVNNYDLPTGTSGSYIANSIVDGNQATTGADYYNLAETGPSGYFNVGGNLIGISSPIRLGPLGNYGGPTQTMLPLPGSPAICAAYANGAPTDQRGGPRTTTYSGVTCDDSGSVQTNYQLSFFQQPTNVVKNTPMSPAPSVVLLESGQAYLGGSLTIPLKLSTGPGILSGGSASTPGNCLANVNCNLATYTNLSIDTPASGDVLSASLVVGTTGTTSLSTTAASNPFNVTNTVTQLAFGTPPTPSIMPGGNPGNAITVQEETPSGAVYTSGSDSIMLSVTGPSEITTTLSSATAVNGIATFNLSSYALTASGNYLYTASLAGVTSATATETVATLDFTFTETTTFQTVVPGASIKFLSSVTPNATTGTYPGDVFFTVSGLPMGATGTFAPATVGANSGAGATAVTLTVQTSAATAAAQNRERRLPPWSLALALLPLAAARRLRRSSQGLRKALLLGIALLASATASLGLSGCGSHVGGGFLSAPPKNYTITITATSGTVVHSQTATLNLQ